MDRYCLAHIATEQRMALLVFIHYPRQEHKGTSSDNPPLERCKQTGESPLHSSYMMETVQVCLCLSSLFWNHTDMLPHDLTIHSVVVVVSFRLKPIYYALVKPKT